MAVLFAAAQSLIAKVVVPDIHPRVLVFYRNGMAAVGIAAWIVPAGRFDLSLVHLDTWIMVLGGAILGPWAGVMLFFASLRYWELSRSSLVQIAQPLFVLPMAGRQIGVKLDIFSWAVWTPVAWLLPFFKGVAGIV